MDNELQKMLEIAKKARENAYAPYSKYKVGSCIKSKNNYYGGCNVENASFGATICAERSSVMKMISVEGKTEIEKVLVLTDEKNPAPPCALCLQVLAEFCTDNTKVYLFNLENKSREFKFKDLLPYSFTSF